MTYKAIKTIPFIIVFIITLTTSCNKDIDDLYIENFELDTNTITETNDDLLNLSPEKITQILEIDQKELSDEILFHINTHRTKLNLPILINNQTAKIQAIVHSQNQAKTNHISHDGNTNRFTVIHLIEHASFYGENVGFGYFDMEKLVEAWSKSEKHKANLEGNFTHTGIGTVANDKGVLYFTQEFFK